MNCKYLMIAVAALVTACTQAAGYDVSGTWAGGDGEQVYILKARPSDNGMSVRWDTIDVAVVKDGQFRMSKPMESILEATFRAGGKNVSILLEPTAPVVITCTMTEREQTIVVESPVQGIYREFINAVYSAKAFWKPLSEPEERTRQSCWNQPRRL